MPRVNPVTSKFRSCLRVHGPRIGRVKGARALASGMLVLAAICAVPAVSAAQDSGTPVQSTTTATTPVDPTQPVESGGSATPAPPSGGPVAGDLSPNDGETVRDSSRGSVGVP